MFDFLFFIFYCAAADDGTKSNHKTVAYGMELVATQLLSFFSFIIIGAINFRAQLLLSWVVIISLNAMIAHFSINSYYIKSGRYIKIIENYSTISNRKKILYKTIVIFIFMISFVLLFVGGIMMSYLFSLYE
jgi:hypothetical protein